MIPLYLDKTAPIAIHGVATPTSHDIKNPITYMSLPAIILNDPTNARDNMYDVEDVSVSASYDETVEPNADRDGSISGPPRELQKILTIRGFVRATSHAALVDKIAALNRAFNPVLAWRSDSDIVNRGFLPLKFAVPTADTTSWPDGYIPQQYYARPIRVPVPVTTKFDDFNARFTIALRLADPRRYHQTVSTASRTGDGNVTVSNDLATYPSWPSIALDFTTAAAADINIVRTNSANGAVTLLAAQLTDSANKVLTLDYANHAATYAAGNNKIAAVKSTSSFQDVVEGATNTFSFTNLPADCVVTITWRRAFA